jgi:hypothetical protein
VGQSGTREIRDAERWLEIAVSRVIAEMRVLWVDVNDEPGTGSARSKIERSSISLLSRAEPPSALWLGRHAAAPQIRSSGVRRSFVEHPRGRRPASAGVDRSPMTFRRAGNRDGG